LVEFADAYGLLPEWNDKTLGVIFGGSCEGYGLIATEPFHYLEIACKLQSKTICNEAIIHPTAIYDKLYHNFEPDEDAANWLREVGGKEFYAQFKAHAYEFGKKMNDIERRFIHIQPQCCGKIGAAL
jgi:hypothetical protein